MYRVVAVIACASALAACSSNAQLVDLDIFKPKPVMETVQFESEPPGAEVKLPNGQTCQTPCALALPATGTYSATYTLTGYEPDTETITPTSMGDNTAALRPNPVLVQLTAATPPKPARRKKARHRVVKHKAERKRPAAKPKAKKPTPPAKPQAAAPAPAPAQPAPQSSSPWPPVQH